MISHSQSSARAIVCLAGLLFAVVVPACSCRSNPVPPVKKQLHEVSVRFPIPMVESGQASFYLAQDRGYYEREGLKVSWQMGSKELNPIKMVAAGSDTFGVIGGPDTVLVARAQGQPVKADRKSVV